VLLLLVFCGPPIPCHYVTWSSVVAHKLHDALSVTGMLTIYLWNRNSNCTSHLVVKCYSPYSLQVNDVTKHKCCTGWGLMHAHKSNTMALTLLTVWLRTCRSISLSYAGHRGVKLCRYQLIRTYDAQTVFKRKCEYSVVVSMMEPVAVTVSHLECSCCVVIDVYTSLKSDVTMILSDVL